MTRGVAENSPAPCVRVAIRASSLQQKTAAGMKKEHRELRHRLLLTPVLLPVLVGVSVLVLAAGFISGMTTTTVVVVRHAEKELGTIADPPLSTAGEQRAELLARLFGERSEVGKLAAVFASDSLRAQRTAAPLATRLGVAVTTLPADDVEQLLRRIRTDYRGRSVLVVGHINTAPEIVRRLSGVEVPAMHEEEYSTIYIVTVPTLGRPSVLRMSY
jgi:phosphohistidine phosphatase SixA